eukprot:m.560907 g.560907  ORF g.560907 m.560907 type:complete len:111 (-) comp22212_c2_seq30:24-356(-)
MWQHDCSATADQEHGVLPHNMTQPNTLHRHTSSLSHTKWRHEHPWCSKIRITTGASVRKQRVHTDAWDPNHRKTRMHIRPGRVARRGYVVPGVGYPLTLSSEERHTPSSP